MLLTGTSLVPHWLQIQFTEKKMGHSVHDVVAGLQRAGSAHAAQMAGEEDREAARQLCSVLGETGRRCADEMFQVARNMTMPDGFWNVRFRDAKTGECIGGKCRFDNLPLAPYEIAMGIESQMFFRGRLEKVTLGPTIHHGTMELNLTFQEDSLPSWMKAILSGGSLP